MSANCNVIVILPIYGQLRVTQKNWKQFYKIPDITMNNRVLVLKSILSGTTCATYVPSFKFSANFIPLPRPPSPTSKRSAKRPIKVRVNNNIFCGKLFHSCRCEWQIRCSDVDNSSHYPLLLPIHKPIVPTNTPCPPVSTSP